MTVKPGPYHASHCRSFEPHEGHRHDNGVDNEDGYELCSGVKAPDTGERARCSICGNWIRVFYGEVDNAREHATIWARRQHPDHPRLDDPDLIVIEKTPEPPLVCGISISSVDNNAPCMKYQHTDNIHVTENGLWWQDTDHDISVYPSRKG